MNDPELELMKARLGVGPTSFILAASIVVFFTSFPLGLPGWIISLFGVLILGYARLLYVQLRNIRSLKEIVQLKGEAQ